MIERSKLSSSRFWTAFNCDIHVVYISLGGSLKYSKHFLRHPNILPICRNSLGLYLLLLILCLHLHSRQNVNKTLLGSRHMPSSLCRNYLTGHLGCNHQWHVLKFKLRDGCQLREFTCISCLERGNSCKFIFINELLHHLNLSRNRK